MCRSCPRTEAQEADLLAAPLGQIRLNDIAGWPLLISIAVRRSRRMAVMPPSRLASVRGPFSRLWPPLPCSKKSRASFLAAPTDRHGRSPTARDWVDSLATSRRPNSRLGQILHSCGSNGDGHLKFQTAAGRAWRCRAGLAAMRAVDNNGQLQGPADPKCIAPTSNYRFFFFA